MADLFEGKLFMIAYINTTSLVSEAYLYNIFYSLPAAQRFFDDLAIKLKKDFASTPYSWGEQKLTLASVSVEEFDKLDIGKHIHMPQSREVFGALCRFKKLTLIQVEDLGKKK